MRRSNRSFPFFARNWISKKLRAVCAGMRFRFGQVLARTEATLSGFRLVRNLSEPHVRPGHLSNALISIEFWLAVAASALPSGNVPVRAQKCGIEMPTGHSKCGI